MEWLVIAVITTVIVVIGAVVTYTQISHKKKANKAPFIKTYASGSAKEMRPRAEPIRFGIESSQSNTQSDLTTNEENPAISDTLNEPIQRPSTTLKPSPAVSAVKQTTFKSDYTVAPIRETDMPQVDGTMAKQNYSSQNPKPEASQTVAEITEVKSEPIEKEVDSTSEESSAKFITEIESEPTRIAAQEEIAEAETDEIEESDKPSQKTQDEKVAELLDFGTLNDWVEIAKSSLSKDNFQIVYNKIVKLTYPRRKETKMREIFLAHAHKYVDSFNLDSPDDSTAKYIYKCLAIVLQEDRNFNDAFGLCRKAIQLGLDDGTKTGYPGRIERLKKAQNTNKK
jgi:hypothetical protein